MTLTANVKIKLTKTQNRKRTTKNSPGKNNCYRQNYHEATNFGVEVMKYLYINNEITEFSSLFNTMSFRF